MDEDVSECEGVGWVITPSPYRGVGERENIFPCWAAREAGHARRLGRIHRLLADPDGFLWEVAWNPQFPAHLKHKNTLEP